jgi:hypothetical protein
MGSFSRAIEGTLSSSTTTYSLDFSECSVGDLAFVQIHTLRDPVGATSSAPSGWTRVDKEAGYYRVLFYKVLEAGDIGTLSWVWGSSAKGAIGAVVYTGDNLTVETIDDWQNANSESRWRVDNVDMQSPIVLVCGGEYGTTIKAHDLSLLGLTERLDYGNTTADFWMAFGDMAWEGGVTEMDNAQVTVSSAVIAGGWSIGIGTLVSLTPIDKSFSLGYDIREFVSKEFTPTYSIREFVSKTFEATYDILSSAVSKTFELLYDIREFVSQEFELEYDIKGNRFKRVGGMNTTRQRLQGKSVASLSSESKRMNELGTIMRENER